MDVTCERCGTEYEFDETLVAARGTTVKCTNCGHLFKVFRPGAASPSAATESRSWSVRRVGAGTSETIASLKELQRLITIGQLTPDDQISRSGEGWKKLGDIAELQTFFQAAAATRPPAKPERRDQTDRGRVTDKRAYAPTAELPTHSTERPAPPSSAPAAGGPLPRTGKSTMMGVGGLPSSKSAPAPPDEVRGRTIELAVPPPANPPPRSSAGSVSAPRPQATSAGGHLAPASRPPPPVPRAAPPSSRPPPPASPHIPPPSHIPPPPRAPSLGAETQPDLGYAPKNAPVAPVTRPVPSAAPERERPSVRPLRVDDDDDVPLRAPVKSRSGLWVGLVVLLAVGIGVAAGWDRITALIAAQSADPAAPFVAAGEDSLAGDHDEAYDDAIGQFTKALAFREHEPRALTGLSRAHALIAQDRLFAASDLEARAGADPALRFEAASLRSQATEHIEEAREHAEAAARHGSGAADAEIALSDALRLSGDPTLARSRLSRARTIDSAPSAEALRVEAMLEADQAGNVAAARTLAERAVGEDPGLLRARLLLARAELATGNVSAARSQLDAVLSRVSTHPGAIALRDAIDGGLAPAAPVLGAPPDAGPAVAAIAPPVVAPPVAPVAPVAPVEPSTEEVRGSASGETVGGGGGGSQNYEALIREGNARIENGDGRRARAAFEQALRARAGGVEATAGLGFVMLHDGNARGAISSFQSAADRGYAEAYIGLGDAHRRLGQLREALDAYEHYLSRAPSGPSASIARRQADRLRHEVGGATGGATGTPGGSTSGETGSTGSGETGSTGASDTPVTHHDELPGPREVEAPPPQDVPAIDSEP